MGYIYPIMPDIAAYPISSPYKAKKLPNFLNFFTSKHIPQAQFGIIGYG